MLVNLNNSGLRPLLLLHKAGAMAKAYRGFASGPVNKEAKACAAGRIKIIDSGGVLRTNHQKLTKLR